MRTTPDSNNNGLLPGVVGASFDFDSGIVVVVAVVVAGGVVAIVVVVVVVGVVVVVVADAVRRAGEGVMSAALVITGVPLTVVGSGTRGSKCSCNNNSSSTLACCALNAANALLLAIPPASLLGTTLRSVEGEGGGYDFTRRSKTFQFETGCCDAKANGPLRLLVLSPTMRSNSSATTPSWNTHEDRRHEG